MIPISDDNPTVRLPVMTLALLGAMAIVWLFVQGGGFDERNLVFSICNLGLVPGELSGAAPVGSGIPITRGLDCVIDDQAINWFTPVISMFLHGSWAHLLGNGLFLWVFGNNIEDVMGWGRFLGFYLLCGLAAAATHVLLDPASPVPTVGASGAISGVMGAGIAVFTASSLLSGLAWSVESLVFFRVIPLPEWIELLWWFGLQVLIGLPQLARTGDLTGGVAVWAHIGGFVAGALIIRAFERVDLVERRRAILLQRGLLPVGD